MRRGSGRGLAKRAAKPEPEFSIILQPSRSAAERELSRLQHSKSRFQPDDPPNPSKPLSTVVRWHGHRDSTALQAGPTGQQAQSKPISDALIALLPTPKVIQHGNMSVFHPEHPTSIPLGVYEDNQPPTAAMLVRARRIFNRPARQLFSTHQFYMFPADSTAPEILILGRSNVGKSTLLNALCGVTQNVLASESSKPGHTRCMHVYGIGSLRGSRVKLPRKAGMSLKMLGNAVKTKQWKLLKTEIKVDGEGIVIIDTPGYGMSSREEWGKQITKLLKTRKQIRRVLILVDWNHGLDDNDLSVMRLCSENNAPFQLILTKVEECLWPKGHNRQLTAEAEAAGVPRLQAYNARMRALLAQHMKKHDKRKGAQKPPVADTLWTAAKQHVEGIGRLGINQLRWAILQACGLDRGSKADFLEGIAILDDVKGADDAPNIRRVEMRSRERDWAKKMAEAEDMPHERPVDSPDSPNSHDIQRNSGGEKEL